ncbi:MAG TPA: hypothetical protein VEC37_06325 [Bacillota bacterium]|nr:hypothetical protein [Bacillota bacterium]
MVGQGQNLQIGGWGIFAKLTAEMGHGGFLVRRKDGLGIPGHKGAADNKGVEEPFRGLDRCLVRTYDNGKGRIGKGIDVGATAILAVMVVGMGFDGWVTAHGSCYFFLNFPPIQASRA